MNESVKICGVLAAGSLLSLLIKEKDRGISYLIGVSGVIVAALFAVSEITPLVEYTSKLNYISTDMINIILRALGISYISEIASSICRDSGENGLAASVDLVGKIELIVISFPMIKQLIEICTSLLE